MRDGYRVTSFPAAQTYGANGEVETETDGGGRVTRYIYDGLGRLSEIHHPDPANLGSWLVNDYEAYLYDNNGNITFNRRRNGSSISFVYDHLNRMTSSTLNNASFAYDNLGRMTAMSDVSGNGWGWEYDALGRVRHELGPIHPDGVYYEHNADGRLTKMTWPGGFSAGYSWYSTGEMAGVWVGAAGSGTEFAHYGYDDLGRRTVLNRANGSATAYAYGDDLRLSYMTHYYGSRSDDQHLAFGFDPAGQLHAINNAAPNYEWSPQGANIRRTYTPDGQNKLATTQLWSNAPTSYGYDLKGNLTNDGQGMSFGYDTANRLTSAQGASLSYDPLGRLSSTVDQQGNAWRFLYAGDRIIAEVGAQGFQHLYLPGAGDGETAVWYDGDAGAHPWRWLMQDWAGSVVAASDDAANPVAKYTYDEAGVPGASNDVGRFQWRGQPYIPEAGTYHMGARAYSPSLGRFLQPDPIGTAGGLNFYAYAGNDPVNSWDPSGLAPPPIPATNVGEVVVEAFNSAKFLRDLADISQAATRAIQNQTIGFSWSEKQAPQREQKPACASQYLQLSGVLSLSSFKWATGATGSLSFGVSIPLDSWRGLQATFTTSEAQYRGTGLFIGAGANVAAGVATQPWTTGISVSISRYAEAGGGIVGTVGGSAQWSHTSASAAVGLPRLGVGAGLYQGRGTITDTTRATRPAGC